MIEKSKYAAMSNAFDDAKKLAKEKADDRLALTAGSAVGPTPERYQWKWMDAEFDFYRLCEILGIEHHAQAHALKKLIRAGRSVKSIDQDIDETIDALLRWKEMLTEDRQNDKDLARRALDSE